LFISSTGGLKEERDAIESVLKEMDVDGERFGTWLLSQFSPTVAPLDLAH
jgi:hypothetical protein